MSSSAVTPKNGQRKKLLILAVKILVMAAVAWGLRGSILDALTQLKAEEWKLRPGWVVAAGFLYLVGLSPMAWYWRRVLHKLDHTLSHQAIYRAYYIGHLGKYAPFKGFVIIIRAALIKHLEVPVKIAVVSVFLETMTMMAAGAALALLFTGSLGNNDPKIFWGSLALMLIAGIPTFPPVFKFIVKFTGKDKEPEPELKPEPEHSLEKQDAVKTSPLEETAETALPKTNKPIPLDQITYRLMLEGWIAGTISWIGLAISLWATLHAVGIEKVGGIEHLPLWLVAVSLSMVAGFLSGIPGGAGVRDGILVALLVPMYGTGPATVTAIILRLVWLVSELLISLYFYPGILRDKKSVKTPSKP